LTATAATTSEVVLEAMGDPRTYPRRPDRVDVVETHGAWVFLAGDRAYKVKKPVVLPFLDYGTLERRRAMCRKEVRLNRRLAPRIYLGTVAVVRRDGQFALVADDDTAEDDVVDVAVEMRRFPEDDTLAARVVARAAVDGHTERIGQVLATFHLLARSSPDVTGATRALETAMGTTLYDLRGLVAGVVAPERIAALRRFLVAFMRGRATQLERRGRRGLVRDGHGDLRAEHVVLTEPPQIVDCVEFDPALRIADVAVDLSFLLMDLEDLGAPDAARQIVDAYRRAGGDPGDDRPLDALACFRALVRAKVAAVRASQRGDAAARSIDDVRRLVALAERLAWRARGPLVIACTGPAASGKSTLAAVLSRQSRLPHLGSDVIRKSLLGLAPTERAPALAYSPDMTTGTYRQLSVRTAASFDACGGAIVDATFHTAALRRTFLDALGPIEDRVLFVECRAPAAVLEHRAEQRRRDPDRISDATSDVVRLQLAAWEPYAGVPARRHLIVPADQPPEYMADAVLAWLDRRLEDGH
jgi:aminoglycoside phosphotransferase family enzyme/predicted kinase